MTISLPIVNQRAKYIGGFRSMMAITAVDDGESTNMVVFLHHEPNVYTPDLLPNAVWRGNLFGMATNNLVSSRN